MSWHGRLRTANTLYELEEVSTSIGRDAANDLVLDSRGISRFHAVLQFTTNSGPVLTDKGSANGTFVNSHRLVKDTPFRLNHGDLIFFSAYERTHYRFEVPEGDKLGELPVYVTRPAKEPVVTGSVREAWEIQKRFQYGEENLTNVDRRAITPTRPFRGEGTESRNKLHYGDYAGYVDSPTGGRRGHASSSGVNRIDERSRVGAETGENNSYHEDLSDIRAEQARHRSNSRSRSSVSGQANALGNSSRASGGAVPGGPGVADGGPGGSPFVPSSSARPVVTPGRTSSYKNQPEQPGDEMDNDIFITQAQELGGGTFDMKKKSIGTPPAVKERLEFLEQKVLAATEKLSLAAEAADNNSGSGSTFGGQLFPQVQKQNSSSLLGGGGLFGVDGAGSGLLGRGDLINPDGSGALPESQPGNATAAAAHLSPPSRGTASRGPGAGTNMQAALEKHVLEAPQMAGDALILQRAMEILGRVGRTMTKGWDHVKNGEEDEGNMNEHDVTMQSCLSSPTKVGRKKKSLTKAVKQEEKDNMIAFAKYFRTAETDMDKRMHTNQDGGLISAAGLPEQVLHTTRKIEALLRETDAGRDFLGIVEELLREKGFAAGARTATEEDMSGAAGSLTGTGTLTGRKSQPPPGSAYLRNVINESELLNQEEEDSDSDDDESSESEEDSEDEQDAKKRKNSRPYLTSLVKQQDFELAELRHRVQFYQKYFPGTGGAGNDGSTSNVIQYDTLTAWRDRTAFSGSGPDGAFDAQELEQLLRLATSLSQEWERCQESGSSSLPGLGGSSNDVAAGAAGPGAAASASVSTVPSGSNQVASHPWWETKLEATFLKAKISRAQENLRKLRTRSAQLAREILKVQTAAPSSVGLFAGQEVAAPQQRQAGNSGSSASASSPAIELFRAENEQKAFQLQNAELEKKLSSLKEHVIEQKERADQAAAQIFAKNSNILDVLDHFEEVKNCGTLERSVELENCARFLHWKLLAMLRKKGADKNASSLFAGAGGSRRSKADFKMKLKPGKWPPEPRSVGAVVAELSGGGSGGADTGRTGMNAIVAGENRIARKKQSSAARMDDMIADALQQHNLEQARVLRQLWRERQDWEARKTEELKKAAEEEKQRRLEAERLAAEQAQKPLPIDSDLDAAFLKPDDPRSGVRFFPNQPGTGSPTVGELAFSFENLDPHMNNSKQAPDADRVDGTTSFFQPVGTRETVGGTMSGIAGNGYANAGGSVVHPPQAPAPIYYGNDVDVEATERLERFQIASIENTFGELDEKLRNPMKYVPQVTLELPDD
mmetsp:Transcript_8531/g.20634  ORF Transcript_8531/g.20634 Transcript_8531/m.20634 type:complete len:1288 (+) Transcript_8531:184-4047(+)|eukprot:g11283.t1